MPEDRDATRWSLDDLLGHHLVCLDGQGRESLTRTRYIGVAKVWISPVIGSKSTRQVAADDIDRCFANMREARRSPSSMSQATALPSGAFKWAPRTGKVLHDPMLGSQLPKSTYLPRETQPPEATDISTAFGPILLLIGFATGASQLSIGRARRIRATAARGDGPLGTLAPAPGRTRPGRGRARSSPRGAGGRYARCHADMSRDAVRGDRVETSVVERELLVRYRVMAFTTATLLIILVFAGIPLQFAAGRPEVVNVVGTIHGFLYLVYLYVAFQLTRRLGMPKWQMALVLVAGTVPFCAFVAERKMTRRFEARDARAEASADRGVSGSLTAYAARVRKRWFSRRALLLHLEVAIVAPGCAAAGWWQATRALAGNGLSWAYSVEWPAFALLAIAGWWHLVHEDPEVYRARKQRPPGGRGGGEEEEEVTVEGTTARLAATPGREEEVTVEGTTARLATTLAVLVGVEFVLGIVALSLVPPGRPSGWLPAKWATIYLAHAILGLPLAFGAVVLLARIRGSRRISRLSGWIGAVGVAIAGAGGLLTVAHPLRLAGMAFMLVGAVIAGFGYLFPTFEKLGA